jgi:hypothetical protein
MTRDECIRQAIGRIVRLSDNRRGKLHEIALEALAPLDVRDKTVVDGRGYAERRDPETGEMETVEVQLHPPGPVVPYRYGTQDVLWLEREIRRRAGI